MTYRSMSADNRTSQLDRSAPVSAMSGETRARSRRQTEGSEMEGETVIAGVDTHKDVHVLCLLHGLGRDLEAEVRGPTPGLRQAGGRP